MRTRAVALSILSSAAVLAVGWQLGEQGRVQDVASAASTSTQVSAPTATPTPSSTADSGTAASGTAAASGSSAAAATATPTPSTAAGVSGTFTGAVSSTRFGDVQVSITVADGTITDVTALKLTDKEQKSVSISNRAAPVLRQEVLAAQSAQVKSVSGATYTSDAYLTSLQSALDQAGL
ncbi:FMN-binding protein [Subtercola boreus]|uniref:FMN-binding domain-containing protein n=1 Tax=Subtercola boreus TaxID=120213 RepID=A0A3E0W6I3_9MICO|nr:FMN-binding protein [Subtercola boreus]RFA18092.1 hypothetical protein B7R24_15700 [Subtercola boreus]RFA18474.1 hypothetical protein B7R23_15735 [Subtercola boreus]RFA25002.1 hypothetical protein B7R25_15730 [Subtercola boreus]